MRLTAMAPWTRGGKLVPLRDRFFTDPGFPEMDQLFKEMTQGFDMRPLQFKERHGCFNPRLDVLEKENALEVSVELPGMNAKEIDLSIQEGVLTIHGEKKYKEEKKEARRYRQERAFGTFHRTISLPPEIEEEKVEATFDQGILKIILPKIKEVPKNIRHIQVKTI